MLVADVEVNRFMSLILKARCWDFECRQQMLGDLTAL